MPLARYFLLVGAALLALLFVADAYFPKLPATVSADDGFDKATIRIHSDRKWPQAVIFDTSQTSIVPAPVAVAQAGAPATPAVADVSANARARDAFARLQAPPAGAGATFRFEPAWDETAAEAPGREASRRSIGDAGGATAAVGIVRQHHLVSRPYTGAGPAEEAIGRPG